MRPSFFAEREIDELWEAGAGFALEFASLKSQFEVFRAIKRVMSEYDFKAFMVIRMPRDMAEMSISTLSIISSWPTEMLTRYDELGLLLDSPVMRRLMSSVSPFRFDFYADPQEQSVNPAPLARELFLKFDLGRGVYLPACDAYGNRGFLLLSGNRPPLTVEDVLRLQIVATLAFEKLSKLQYADEKPGEALSDREVDCLLWTSAGKTSAEISEILGLSEHTVNHYLNRAAKKLGTVNRTQAVAKALRIGLIK